MFLLIYTYNLNALLCARRITHNMCWHPLPASPSPLYSSWWSLLLLLLLLMLCCRLSSPCFPTPLCMLLLSLTFASSSHPHSFLLHSLAPPKYSGRCAATGCVPGLSFFFVGVCPACLVYQRFKAFLSSNQINATRESSYIAKCLFLLNAFA